MQEEIRKCYDCLREKPITAFPANPKGDRGLRCSACEANSYRKRLRLQFLEAFDFKCSCCGADHPWFLTLEHVEGGARKERRDRKLANLSPRPSYHFLVDAAREGFPRDKYECLCFNCNCSKGFYGQCPHKAGTTREDAIEQLREDAEYLRHPNQTGGKGIPRGPLSEDHRRKISESTRGIPKSAEARANMVEAWKERRGEVETTD